MRRGGDDAGPGAPHRVLQAFERAVILTLIVVIAAVVVLTTVQLVWTLVGDVIHKGPAMLGEREAFDLLGIALLVLIGLELLETIKAFLDRSVIDVEIVLEVALIAVARKVIVLDLAKYSALDVVGIAALIATLAAAFFLERRARARTK